MGRVCWSLSSKALARRRALDSGNRPFRKAASVLWLARPQRLVLRADSETYELELPAPLVGTAEALALFEEGSHLFIDARPGAADLPDGIPGALPIAAETFDADLEFVIDFVYPEDPLIVYDGGRHQSAID